MTTRRIVIIADDPARAATVEAGAGRAPAGHVEILPLSCDLENRIRGRAPDVVVIDLADGDPTVVEKMLALARDIHRPIVMFAESSDSEMVDAAVEAGIGAYVVGGLKEERIPHIIDTAISRFNFLERLRRERDAARTALAERKLVERAKGLLMREKGLSEEAAYAAMRRSAMKSNRKLVAIAQGIITTYEMDI